MFTTIDWIIVGCYLALSLAFGVWGKRFIGSVSDYLVAGRELGLYIGIATLAATETGTITFMYNGEFGYRYGFVAFAAALISGGVMILVGKTGFVISRLRQLELMTVPEYFEKRYSRGLRLLVGALVAIGGILNMGVFLRVEGEFLTTVSGLDRRYLIAAMTFILLLELVYTVLGGMISVVITDFFQYVLLATATLVVSTLVVLHTGWDTMVSKVAATMGHAGFNPFANSKLGFSFIVWQILLWLSLTTCWQTTAMRVFSTRDPATSRRVMTWTGYIFLGRGILPMLWGIAALTVYGVGRLASGAPLPIVNGIAMRPIDAMPALLGHLLPAGLKGIVVAGMLAATMSVNSSYLLGWSAVISQDVILPMRRIFGRRELSSGAQIAVNRVANLFVSLFLMFWGLYYSPPGAVYFYLNITGTIFLAGAFICVLSGLYWKRASTLGGYLAMGLGAAGAIVPFFFLHWSENSTGLIAFGLAALGMVFGSVSQRPTVTASPASVEIE